MYIMKHIYPQYILHIIYSNLMIPHFNYCLLVCGLKVLEGHKPNLLQKNALRILQNDEYLAHTEPICKGIVKVIYM